MRIRNSARGRAPGARVEAARRAGGILVEFALVSLVLYLLIAALIGFGRWMQVSQSAQDAARIAAREIALYPLPAEYTFLDALADPGFRQAVYDPDYLVVDLDEYPPEAGLEGFFAAMPVVNRALRPLMIQSIVEVDGVFRDLLHLPGVVTDSATSPSGLTVVVPRIDARDADTGTESAITLVPVLQEVGAGAFSILSPERGLVAVRLNVPYQSATLTAYWPTDELRADGDPFLTPLAAVDPGGGGHRIVGPKLEGVGVDGAGAYSGTYGLGEHIAYRTRVRPFRRLIAAQAIFRREVFL